MTVYSRRPTLALQLLWTVFCMKLLPSSYSFGTGRILRTLVSAPRHPHPNHQYHPSSSSLRTIVRRSMSSSSSLVDCPTIPLRDGTAHPAIGFGTYKVGFIPASASSAVAGSDDTSHQRTARECVRDALEVGYRCLECAEFYGNEAQVGLAIQDASLESNNNLQRADLFLVSKVWTTTIEQGPAAIRKQVDQTLADLQTDYLDLYLVHWPVPGHHVAAYETLLELRSEGKIRSVGVSNYAWEDYLELKEHLLQKHDNVEPLLPVVNQIEINPFLYRRKTIANFQSEGVVLQSYRSLKDGKQMTNPVLVEMASRYGGGKSVAQILGRWCVQKQFVYIPKSVQRSRMLENSQVFDDDDNCFVLTDADMDILDNLTTPESLEAFQALYRKCVNRDTSKDGTMDGVKMNITID